MWKKEKWRYEKPGWRRKKYLPFKGTPDPREDPKRRSLKGVPKKYLLVVIGSQITGSALDPLGDPGPCAIPKGPKYLYGGYLHKP